MPRTQIKIDPVALRELCQRHGVSRLLAFGSVLREDFDPESSDVDILVEFLPNVHRGLFKLVAMRDELSSLLGRDVDLTTPESLGKNLRDRVLASAEVLYDAA